MGVEVVVEGIAGINKHSGAPNRREHVFEFRAGHHQVLTAKQRAIDGANLLVAITAHTVVAAGIEAQRRRQPGEVINQRRAQLATQQHPIVGTQAANPATFGA